MNRLDRNIVLGVLTFYATLAMIAIYRGSPPSVIELVASGVGFAIVFGAVWTYRRSK